MTESRGKGVKPDTTKKQRARKESGGGEMTEGDEEEEEERAFAREALLSWAQMSMSTWRARRPPLECLSFW